MRVARAPSSWRRPETRTQPAYARAESVIAVGATTMNGREAEYSNAGLGLDVVAPGGASTPRTPTTHGMAACRPDSLVGEPIYQETFRWLVRRFGLPKDLRAPRWRVRTWRPSRRS